MNTGAFDMLHDAADNHVLAIAQGVNIQFYGVVKEFVDQNRMLGRSRNRVSHIMLEGIAVIDDFHSSAAEHIGRPNQDWITQTLGNLESLFIGTSDAILWLLDTELVEESCESFSVLGQIDAVRRGADDLHPGPFQRQCKLQRGLAAELNDYAVGVFPLHNVQDLFQSQRFEIKLVRRIVIRADGFRIAVDHDGFITFFPQGEGRVHAAVVELDALADAIGATAQDHDLFSLRRVGFVFPFVGRIEIGREGCKLSATGIHRAKNRFDALLLAQFPDLSFGAVRQRSEMRIGEAQLLPGSQSFTSDLRYLGPPSLNFALRYNDLTDLFQEPRIDAGQLINLLGGHAQAKGVTDIPKALSIGVL